MNEVSCRALGIFLRDAKRKKIPVEQLLVGTSVTAAHASTASERIDWSDFTTIMSNCSRLWTEAECIELGGAFFRDKRMRPISLVARVLFEAKDFYKWLGKDREGAGDQLFSCVQSEIRELSQQRLEIQLTMAAGYEPCRTFYLVSLGSLRDAPRILMLPPAGIEMTVGERGARFTIDVPPGGGIIRRVRKFLLAPFTSVAIARALVEANSALEERYRQLDSARQQLAVQATQLRVANEIGQLIHADLDLDRTLKLISESLITVAKFSRARIRVSYSTSEANLVREYEFGSASAGARHITLPLTARGTSLGTLELWSAVDTVGAEFHNKQLFDHVLPGICMAIDESIAFTIVSNYRNKLEERVAQRTSELQAARDSLSNTVRDLEEAQAVRSRIFANINHEIRTPLSLVLLAAGEIRVRHLNKNDPKTLASVASIDAACERLLSMVDSMLLLAAGQEGKLKIHRRACDIAVEIRRLVSIWTPLAKEHKLHLSYDGPERLEGYVDTAALERIMANLLSNAIKYTPDTGSIWVSLKQDGDKLLVTVRDTGIGIDEEFKKRIFGRFEQGRAAVRAGARSTGIGLSIVKELTEAHGGAVTVDNNRGGGTIFNLVFPVVPLEQQVEAHAEAAPFGGPSLPVGFGLQLVKDDGPRVLLPSGAALATVLVAEDDHGLRASVGELLHNAGYKVLLAPDGFAALTLATEHYPDMLLSDVGMPGMDGLQLSRRFRELPGNRLAPVLLLTAFGTTSDKLSGFEAGAIDYMVKPFEPKELLARVEGQLKLRDLALRLSRTEKLASLGTMSAGLAHEIRNPANGLLNALDPLVSMLPPEVLAPDTGTGQLLEVVRDCAQQIGRLSRQLLGFKNDGALTCTDESVQHLVKRALSMVDAKQGNVEVRVRHAYGDRVKCAAPLMLQVLVNLLDNAIQAAGSGGWIEIVTRLDGDKVVFDVSDSGSGVPVDLRERIFEPFFTTKSAGQGTGLGLSTSRHIVEQHQGTLRVVEGVRSTFSVTLPLSGPAQGSVPVNGAPLERSQAAS